LVAVVFGFWIFGIWWGANIRLRARLLRQYFGSCRIVWFLDSPMLLAIIQIVCALSRISDLPLEGWGLWAALVAAILLLVLVVLEQVVSQRLHVYLLGSGVMLVLWSAGQVMLALIAGIVLLLLLQGYELIIHQTLARAVGSDSRTSAGHGRRRVHEYDIDCSYGFPGATYSLALFSIFVVLQPSTWVTAAVLAWLALLASWIIAELCVLPPPIFAPPGVSHLQRVLAGWTLRAPRTSDIEPLA